MIEVQTVGDDGFLFRTDSADDVDLQDTGKDGEGWIRVSSELVGELIRVARTVPHRIPQPDARKILGGEP